MLRCKSTKLVQARATTDKKKTPRHQEVRWGQLFYSDFLLPRYSVKTSCSVVSVAVSVLAVKAPVFLTSRVLSTVRI